MQTWALIRIGVDEEWTTESDKEREGEIGRDIQKDSESEMEEKNRVESTEMEGRCVIWCMCVCLLFQLSPT